MNSDRRAPSHLFQSAASASSLTSSQMPSPPVNASNALLSAVMAGDYIAVEKILAALGSTNAVVIPHEAEETNGRKWKSISPLEFAAWAGDLTETETGRGILNLLLRYVPDDHKRIAFSQLRNLVKHGTQYGVMLAPYKQLILDLHTLAINFNPWSPSKIKRHWEKVIGCAQKELPVVGMQEICDPTKPFYPIPDFNRAPRRSCELADGTKVELGKTSALSNSYAIYKGCGQGAIAIEIRDMKDCLIIVGACVIDRAALVQFCDEKPQILMKLTNALGQHLAEQRTFSHHPRPGAM